MKLLDDLNKRKKLKKLIDELEGDINNAQTIEDLKNVILKLLSSLREMI